MVFVTKPERVLALGYLLLMVYPIFVPADHERAVAPGAEHVLGLGRRVLAGTRH